METPFNPETGKPNPISLNEWFGKDRDHAEQFLRGLSAKEKKDFSVSVTVAFESLPKQKRLELVRIKKEALEKKQNASLRDKVDLAIIKLKEKQLELPSKPVIFLRKLRGPNSPFRKWAAETKSPFLIR